MKRNRVKDLGMFCVIILGVGLCIIGSRGSVMGASSEEIVIGQVHPLTGGNSLQGVAATRGIEYATDEINAKGGIKSMGGAKIKLLHADHQGKPEVGISQTERLAQEGASAIIGCTQSGVALVATQAAEKLKVPFLIDNGQADEITERGFKYTFRFYPQARMQMQGGFKFLMDAARANNPVPKTLVLIHEDSAYGQSVVKWAEKYAPDIGLKLLGVISYDRKAVDFSSEVRKIAALKPDIVGNTSNPADGILLLRTMKEQDIRPMVRLGVSDAAYTATAAYKKGLGDYSNYVIQIQALGMNHHDPRFKVLAEGFARRYKEPIDWNAEMGHQAIYVIKEALELAGSSDRDKIREALARLVYKDHMLATELPIVFAPSGQNENAEPALKQMFPDGDKVVWPPKFGEAKIVWPHPAWKKD